MTMTTTAAVAVAPKAGVSSRRRASTAPLDYSFMGLTSLSEMLQQDPVSGKKKPLATVSTVSASSTGNDGFVSASNVEGTTSLEGAGGSSAPSANTKKLPTPVALRVNNNKISHLDDMHEALGAVFEHPQALQWLDLSGNNVSIIPPQAFAAYPELFTLHLHGNQLSRYADVDALAAWLPRLHSITLHGNPLEEKKHYRNYVIASFPSLKQLNFSCVTRGDREKAETWASIYKHTRAAGGSGKREDEF